VRDREAGREAWRERGREGGREGKRQPGSQAARQEGRKRREGEGLKALTHAHAHSEEHAEKKDGRLFSDQYCSLVSDRAAAASCTGRQTISQRNCLGQFVPKGADLPWLGPAQTGPAQSPCMALAPADFTPTQLARPPVVSCDLTDSPLCLLCPHCAAQWISCLNRPGLAGQRAWSWRTLPCAGRSVHKLRWLPALPRRDAGICFDGGGGVLPPARPAPAPPDKLSPAPEAQKKYALKCYIL
jgi:hypothetical protein